MYCRKCGKQLSDEMTFCAYCGEPVPEHSGNRNGYYSLENENEPFDQRNRMKEAEYQYGKSQKQNPKRGVNKALLIVIIAGGTVLIALTVLLIIMGKAGLIFKKEDVSTGIEEQIQDENGDEMTTAEVERISAGDMLVFGEYEADGDRSNGREPLRWQVLEVDGDRALIITEYAIDAMSYSIRGNTWNESTLRQWLNGTFVSQAFTESERADIIPTTVNTGSNPTYGTYSGSSCTDEVFLISGEEAARYFGADSNRKVTGTSYADENNLFISKTGYCRWWLRDAGQSSGLASVINGDGVIDYYGAPVSESRYGIRPAMWIRVEQ